MEQREIGYLIKQVSDRLRSDGDAKLKKHGLTFSQVRVMEFVAMSGGRVTQKEIEEHLGVSHPTVVGLVARLEKSGFLACCIDEEDRRNKLVSETAEAAKTGACMRRERRRMEERLVRGFSEEEKAVLADMLVRLYRNID